MLRSNLSWSIAALAESVLADHFSGIFMLLMYAGNQQLFYLLYINVSAYGGCSVVNFPRFHVKAVMTPVSTVPAAAAVVASLAVSQRSNGPGLSLAKINR